MNLFPEDVNEREANLFAIELLMPEDLVINWLYDHGCFDEGKQRSFLNVVQEAADNFGVDSLMMIIRLGMLGYVGFNFEAGCEIHMVKRQG